MSRLVTVAVLVAFLVVSVASGSRAGTPVSALQAVERGNQVRVYGCASEDSCRIDYRSDRQGRTVWVIKRQVP